MKKFIILLRGTSCSGKTTISNKLFEKYPGIFLVKSDSIKRFISGYSPEKHIANVTNMSFALSESAMQEGFSILGEIWFDINKYNTLALKYGYSLILINIEAPYNILEKRFYERIAVRQESGFTGYMNTDITRFKGLYEQYLAEKTNGTITFDTSVVSVEEMINEIDTYIV